MKKFLSCLLLLAALFSLLAPCAHADSTLNWYIDGGTLSITGRGEMHDFTSDVAPWRSHEQDIRALEIGYGVTSVGSQAFQYCTKIRTASLPDTVRTIGEAAFYKCISLEEITIPQAVTEIEQSAFAYCTKLKAVVLPEKLREIENAVFNCCEALEEIYIPASVYEIEDSAFNACYALKTVYFGGTERQWRDIDIEGYNKALSRARVVFNARPSDVSSSSPAASGSTRSSGSLYWDYSSDKTLTISGRGRMPDYSTDVPPWVNLRSEIKHIVIEPGVTHVGAQAFQYCSSVRDVTLPDTVTSIGNAAFYKCVSLREIALPTQMTEIGNQVFDFCVELRSVTIPSGIRSIGEAAFNCCESLKSISLPGAVREIGNSAFNGCTALRDVYYDGTSAEWRRIEIESYNRSLLDAAIHTSDSAPNGTIGGVF